LLRIKGEFVLLEGVRNSVDVAQNQFLQAIDLARSQHALSWELRAATSLAQLERDQDRSRKGYELLTAVYVGSLRASAPLIWYPRRPGVDPLPWSPSSF